MGGIPSYCYELGKRFASHCDSFTVIAPAMEGADAIDKLLPFRVIRIKSSNILLGFALIPKLRGILKQLEADIVFHAQWNTLIASLITRQLGYRGKIVCAAHGRELLLNPKTMLFIPFFKLYRTQVIKRADSFYPVSTYTGRLLHGFGVKPEKIHVVPNGTDPDLYVRMEKPGIRQRYGIAETDWLLITTARLVKRKGIDDVIRAMFILKKTYPQIKYLVVGEGPQRQELGELVTALGLEESVCFTGRVAYEELRLYYSAADSFVMVPRTLSPDIEGFGLVYLEANSCELPVISSDSAGVPDAVVDGVTGLVVPEGDTEALTQVIVKLFQDRILARKFGRQGRERVLKTHNWDMVSQRMLQLMDGSLRAASLTQAEPTVVN